MTKVQSHVMLVLYNVKMVLSNVRKNKGTVECDKSTVTCDISITQCEVGTIKYDILVTWYTSCLLVGTVPPKKGGMAELPLMYQ